MLGGGGAGGGTVRTATVHPAESLIVRLHGIGDFAITVGDGDASNDYIPVGAPRWRCVHGRSWRADVVVVLPRTHGETGPWRPRQVVHHGDNSIVVDLDWDVGTNLIPVEINDKPLTLQFLEATPMGFKLVHYGTTVRPRGSVCVGGEGSKTSRAALVLIRVCGFRVPCYWVCFCSLR